jgi:hypothetical protein
VFLLDKSSGSKFPTKIVPHVCESVAVGVPKTIDINRIAFLLFLPVTHYN